VTEADWQACGDPDPMVHALPADRYQRELRLFGVACVRRVSALLPFACRDALMASEHFADGRISESELARAVSAADREAQVACRGYAAPDARMYAISAAVDAASVWPRAASNVLAATSCAASAMACAAAEADEAHYDDVYESARRTELATQADLLRTLVQFSTR
jgi:hypothetical protein